MASNDGGWNGFQSGWVRTCLTLGAAQARRFSAFRRATDAIRAVRACVSAPRVHLPVRVAVFLQHRSGHPPTVTDAQPGSAGPRTHLRTARRTRRLPRTGVNCSRTGPRPRPRRPLPPLHRAVSGRPSRPRHFTGDHKGDSVQRAENPQRVLEGFAGVNGEFHSTPLVMSRDANPCRHEICNPAKQPSPPHMAFTSRDRPDAAGRPGPPGRRGAPGPWGSAAPDPAERCSHSLTCQCPGVGREPGASRQRVSLARAGDGVRAGRGRR